MNPVWRVVIAVFFYAAANVVIGRRLSHVNPNLMIGFLYPGILLVLGVNVFLLSSLPRNATTALNPLIIGLIMLCGIFYACADYNYFAAYNAGGDAVTITTVFATLPVAVAFIKAATGGGFPSPVQWLGCALAAGAVYCTSRG